MQSDSASRKRPFSTGLFIDWTFFRLDSSGPSYRQSSRFYIFRALPRGGWCEGVLLYSSRNRLAVLCFALSPRATARRTLVPASWWLWAFSRSRQSYVRGVALSREPPKLQQPQPLLAAWDWDRAVLPSCDTRCWRAKLGMRHADLLREATAEIAKPASAPCMILQCGTWYGCVAVWPCGCVFGGGMSDAIGSKNTCKTFATEFFDWRIQSKKSSFSTGSASRNSQ